MGSVEIIFVMIQKRITLYMHVNPFYATLISSQKEYSNFMM